MTKTTNKIKGEDILAILKDQRDLVESLSARLQALEGGEATRTGEEEEEEEEPMPGGERNPAKAKDPSFRERMELMTDTIVEEVTRNIRETPCAPPEMDDVYDNIANVVNHYTLEAVRSAMAGASYPVSLADDGAKAIKNVVIACKNLSSRITEEKSFRERYFPVLGVLVIFLSLACTTMLGFIYDGPWAWGSRLERICLYERSGGYEYNGIDIKDIPYQAVSMEFEDRKSRKALKKHIRQEERRIHDEKVEARKAAANGSRTK